MGRKRKQLASAIKKSIPKLIKSEKGQKVLKQGAKFVKAKMESFLDATCPSCKKVAKIAVNQPIVKKVLNNVGQKIRKKCPTCGEVMDIVVKA